MCEPQTDPPGYDAKELPPKQMEMIKDCLKAMGAIDDILRRLQQVREYRTEPYYQEEHRQEEHRDASAAGPDIIAI